MSIWVLLMVSAHSGAAAQTKKTGSARLQRIQRHGRDVRARARETLTLHVEPGLVPVLPFGVDGLALVRAHVFVLHVVEVQRRTRFADLVVGRQVCGVHFPPYDVRDGTDNKRFFLFYNMSANRIGCFEAVPLMIVNRTYFPRAKHSSVMLEASRAVVSGNFTLMSAGYFLSSPEAIKKKKGKKSDI